MKSVRSLFWTLPFISFLIGYYALNRLYHIPEMQTPSLVGKTLPEAFTILSAQQLNVRILAEKEDPDLSEGTILSQTPIAQSAIKANQVIFCVVSKKPAQQIAPHLIGKKNDAYQADIKKQHIRLKEYWVESNTPYGHCIAQSPQPHEPMDKNNMIAYISAGNEKPVLFPSFIDIPLEQTMEFLSSYSLKPRISHARQINAHHTCHKCIVIDQRPLPGSLIHLDSKKPILVQLHVAPI